MLGRRVAETVIGLALEGSGDEDVTPKRDPARIRSGAAASRGKLAI
jgi:hypothetical protein